MYKYIYIEGYNYYEALPGGGMPRGGGGSIPGGGIIPGIGMMGGRGPRRNPLKSKLVHTLKCELNRPGGVV